MLLILLFALSGCASYTVTKDELSQHLKENQSHREVLQFLPVATSGAFVFLGSKYPSNGIAWIPCINSSGEKVYLYPDKNTQIEFTSKSTGEVVKMYLDTIFLVEGKLVGLRSRLIQTMTREIALDDIEKAEITAEFPKTRKIK